MNTSLVTAVNNNDFELTKKLIETGADVNQKDSSGNSLLLITSAKGLSQIVKLLLDSGADICAVDSTMKATALHAAAYLGHPEVMKILIAYRIDIDAQSPYNGYTALHDAVWQNNVEGVSILVNAGARLDIESNDGYTPLALANKSGSQEIISILSGEKPNGT